MAYFFDKCDCNLKCLDNTLNRTGYDFQKVQKNVWHYQSQKLFLEIASNFSSQFKLKIDPSYNRSSSESSEIKEEIINLVKILRDICKPDKIVNQGLKEFDYQTLQLKK